MFQTQKKQHVFSVDNGQLDEFINLLPTDSAALFPLSPLCNVTFMKLSTFLLQLQLAVNNFNSLRKHPKTEVTSADCCCSPNFISNL